MKKGVGCNQCSHPSCPNSLNLTGLCSCIECDGGVLALDPNSGPKWKLGCNRCDIIIHLFEDAHKISVEEEVCSCGRQLIKVEYKPVRSLLLLAVFFITLCLTYFNFVN